MKTDRLGLLLVLAAGGACGDGKGAQAPATPASAIPHRAETSGDALLAKLPAGADLLIELDLARLRDNESVGGLARDVLAEPGAETVAVPFVGAIGTPALARADAIVLASYQVGTAQAATVTLVAGGGLTPEELGGVEVGDGVVAVAPPETLEGFAAGPGLETDEELLLLRTRAMPPRATGAILRVTARLDFDARVALASQLELEAAPSTLSLWGDVADDLAVVAVIDAPDQGGGAVGDEVGRAMATGLEAWRDGFAVRPEIRALGLAGPVEEIIVRPRGEGVKVIALVGPRALGRAVRRARTFLLPQETR